MTIKLYKYFTILFSSWLAHITIIASCTLWIFKKTYTNTGFPMWADNALFVLNRQAFFDLANSTYAEKNVGLVYNPIFVSFYFLINKIFYLLDPIINNVKILSCIWVILPYFTLYIIMYVCYRLIFKRSNLALVFTLFYIFSQLNFSWVIAGWSTTTYSQAGALLVLTLIIRYIENPKLAKILVLSIAASLGFSNIAYFYAVIVVACIYTIIYQLVFNVPILDIIKRYRSIIIFPLLFILINAYWILPIPIMQDPGLNQSNFVNIYSSIDLNPTNTLNFASSLQTFSEYSNLFVLFNSAEYRIIYLLLISIIFFYSLKYLRTDKYLKVLLATFIIVFGLTLGKNFKALWDLFSIVPGSFMIRSPQLKFYSSLFFLLSLVAGHLYVIYKKRVILVVIAILIIYGMLGFSKGQIFSYWDGVKLPRDYKEVIKELNKDENKYETVMMFPKLGYLPKLSWTTNQVYSYFILEQITTNPFILYLYGASRVPTYLIQVYDEYNDNTVLSIGDAGIKYLLIHKDFMHIPPKHPFELDEKLINIVDGPNLTLYKVKNDLIKPLFTIDNENTKYSRISPYLYKVTPDKPGTLEFNRQFDKNWLLIEKNIYESNVYNTCMSYLKIDLFCNANIVVNQPLFLKSTNVNDRNSWVINNNLRDWYVFYLPQAYMGLGLWVSSFATIGVVITTCTIYLIKNARNTK